MAAALALAVLAGCANGDEPPPPTTYTVTFNANGGAVTPESLKVNEGKTVPALPQPTKASQYFWGWYADNGMWKEPFNAASVVRADITVYARWGDAAAVWHTVTFDADGGAVTPGSLKVIDKEAAGSLPVPARSAYVFNEWRTAKNGGGNLFTAATVVTAGITVYAQWTAKNASNDGSQTPGNELPAAGGANELAGKSATIYDTYTFNADGTYEYGSFEYGDPAMVVWETGGYSWNSAAKTVSVKPLKLQSGNPKDNTLYAKNEWKKEVVKEYNDMSPAEKKEADTYLKTLGFSSVTAYVNAMAEGEFAVVTFEYDFFDEAKTLVFLQKKLPAKTGSKELYGKSASLGSVTYTFAANAATYATDVTASSVPDTPPKKVVDSSMGSLDYGYGPEQEAGSYLAAAFVEGKMVYLKPATVGGKTPKEYYAGLSYGEDNAAKAALTNSAFETHSVTYTLTGGALTLTDKH